MEPFSNIEVQCLTSEEATVAHLRIELYGIEQVFVGHAKKHPKDRPNDTIGVELALGRALSKAAEYFLKDSSIMINLAESIEQSDTDEIAEFLTALTFRALEA